MIADLKPYAEYMESGLPWLGRLPKHWQVRRMKSAVDNAIAQTDEMTGDEAYVALEHVESWTGKARPQRGANLFSGQVKRFRPDDVLFGKLRPYLAKATRLPVNGVCAGEFFVLRVRDSSLSPSYLEQQVRAKLTIDVINSSTFGAKMPRADWQFVGNLSICFPTPAEQTAIVRFLDWANGRLERAIRAKRKVIALLNEQKQAIIHRAVTRGLDPSVPLKPSGIPWLGDIPQNWEVRRLKFVASRIVDCLHATPRYSDSGNYPAIRTADISPGVVHLARAKRISSTDFVRWTVRLEPGEGDILYSREGERFGIAACVPPGVRLCISQRMMVFRIDGGDCADFVMRLLNCQSTYGQALQDVMGATVPHVNISTIRNYVLALPTKQEQEAIVLHIKCEASPIEIAISRLEREIKLLREYRTRLVADVVTGKLDVREATARLPYEAPPETVEDDVDVSDEIEAADEEAAA
jgi:type I restriction enzyme S subunit